ncbi:acyltransferase [Comamonadaceae bacterium G21597-S1]|nr:acyltransferase [Comamonadaceae bacterium G21597-S1]
MNRPFSVYLDLVRFVAAVLVYLWHSNQRFLTADVLPASNYGHSSVIVFFVLSGFVIAFVTDTKEKTWPSFTASRFSRVYSVAVPTLIVTLVLDAVGRVLAPEIYDYPFDHFLIRLASGLLMANEVWFVSITTFSNVPYWSICYEWWYYVTFAMVMFLPARIGVYAAILTMVVIGPKLILLAPVWWLGVLLYRWRRLNDLSPAVSWFLVVFSWVGIIAYHAYGVADIFGDWFSGHIGADWYRSLTFSKWFLADYLLAVLVFANFAGTRNVVAHGGAALIAVQKPVRFFANYTFTLYLLHQPLFLFWSAVVRGDPQKIWYWTIVTLLTVAAVGLLGIITEHRRYWLRSRLLPVFDRWQSAGRASIS